MHQFHSRPAIEWRGRTDTPRRPDGWRCLPVYAEQVLTPDFDPATSFMDNLSARGISGVREAIERAAAKLL